MRTVERLATYVVERSVVAVELSGAGNAQALAKTRENQLVAIIGHGGTVG